MTEDLHGPLVAVLAYDDLCVFEFSIAYEVFGLPRPEIGPHWYRYRPCAAEPGILRSRSGLTVSVAFGLDGLADADLIIIPGWRRLAEPVPAPLIEALKAAHGRGAVLASLCSGAYVLAATGLLDGHRATTHWRYYDDIAAVFHGSISHRMCSMSRRTGCSPLPAAPPELICACTWFDGISGRKLPIVSHDVWLSRPCAKGGRHNSWNARCRSRARGRGSRR